MYRFVKFVNRGLGKVETILKTAMSPHEPLEMFIDHYFLLISDRNLSNFQRILELKGLKRTDQQQMVDIFQKKQVGMDNLQENSAVMSLLQGMPAHISAQGVVGPSAGLVGNMAGMVIGGSSNGSGGGSTVAGTVAGLMTPGGPGSTGNQGTNTLGNILSHSPFAALASGSPGTGGSGLGGELGAVFGLGNDKDSGSGAGAGAGASGANPTGGSFAAGAKINVNIRKFVAGMRAKRDNDPAPN